MLNRSKKYRYKIIQYLEDIPKPKKNEIVIVPSDNRLMSIPPYLGKKQLPSWWKDLPKNPSSLRRCQGTYDFTTAGFIIPLWCDVTIRPDASGKKFEYRLSNYDDDFNFTMEHFNREATSGCPITKFNKIETGQFPKLATPWRYYTPKGVSLISLPLLYEPNDNYTIVPGIVHTDFYNQVNVVINVLTDKEFTIPAGTPIQHMIPYHRNQDFKKIIWGNESMMKFIRGNGMGKGSLAHKDDAQLYRKFQMEIEKELDDKERSRFNAKFKNFFIKN